METITTEAKLTPKLLEELENIIQRRMVHRQERGNQGCRAKAHNGKKTLHKEERNIIKDVEWGLHG